ncbi:MAG: hypothetical protein EXR62_13635 [Chloroflexi bacterium]|nr:hypothetical protein [Chloroflexota bacterium]
MLSQTVSPTSHVIDIGSRLEPFFDHYLIDRLTGARLKLHAPTPQEVAVHFDAPWEGMVCHYPTVIKDGDIFRLYYRGKPSHTPDGAADEVTCYAESRDGINWTKPNLGIVELNGSGDNSVVLGPEHLVVTHNFTPFLDTRPGVPANERYKGFGGLFDAHFQEVQDRNTGGVFGYASPDGIHWRKWRDQPLLDHTQYAYYTDTAQCCAFWSEREQCYVCYIRTWEGGRPWRPDMQGEIRWIGRTTSPDFLHWSKVENLVFVHDGQPAPAEHLYTNQIHPYVRAPHIYIGLPFRFLPERKAIADHPYPGISDAVFISSRDGLHWDRTFLEAFIRPGRDWQNWTQRTNAPALGVVQTAPDELSVYWIEHYSHPTARLRRGTLRLDGFASVNAGYDGGEMVTRQLRFAGDKLVLNYATSAAGSVRIELQDAQGQPLPGFSLEDCPELYGDEIAQVVSWTSGADVSQWAGHVVRLRFVVKDADIYAMRFQD